MREDICSIPINELFEPKKGCPLCRMDEMLEQRLADPAISTKSARWAAASPSP